MQRTSHHRVALGALTAAGLLAATPLFSATDNFKTYALAIEESIRISLSSAEGAAEMSVNALGNAIASVNQAGEKMLVALKSEGREKIEERRRDLDECIDAQEDALDLAMDARELRAQWGKGKEWTKMWWVWQKLDDRYGPTWYPRWRWVQHERWKQDTPRRLSWDELVEDMSIAVGEDLFPFFKAIGTSLEKSRFERVVFRGGSMELPVAPLEKTPAGPVRLEPIGDFRKPLVPVPRRR